MGSEKPQRVRGIKELYRPSDEPAEVEYVHTHPRIDFGL